MSEHFQPGDMVECINITPIDGRSIIPGLALGEVYTTAAVIVADAAAKLHGTPALTIRGLSNQRGWYAWRFRRLYRPDPKLIERLTAEPIVMPPPAFKPAREDVDA